MKWIFYITFPKNGTFFAFFDRLSSSMLPGKSNFDEKFLVLVFKGKIF